MWSSFKYSLLQMIRVPGMLIWVLIFPIVLGSLFIIMLGSLDDYHDGSMSVNVVVVQDESDSQIPWDSLTEEDLAALSILYASQDSGSAFDAMQMMSADNPILQSISADPRNATEWENDIKAQFFFAFIKGMSEGENALFKVTYAKTSEEAAHLVQDSLGTNHEFAGYVQYTDGQVNAVLTKATDPSESYELEPSVLMLAMDRYAAEEALIDDALRKNPTMLLDQGFIESLSEPIEATVRANVTASEPRESLRYYFALLGMAALFGANMGLVGFQQIRINASSLAARRSLGTLSHGKTAFITLLASWLLAFASLLLLYCYLIVVGGVDFGARSGICVLICLVASLCATAFGCAITSIPKVPDQAKGGIVCGITCIASIFAGLYGSPSMQFADIVSANVPWLDVINPTVQVCQAFYATMYYDTNAQTFMHIVNMLIMTAIFFALSARSLRRQRYASL